ncbi:Hypothetical protein A7982_00701 [Minicystis rosea]|nr:Hypothetical protein A7982_00701 [Minicystis rosea]
MTRIPRLESPLSLGLLGSLALTLGCAGAPPQTPLEDQGLPLITPAAPPAPSMAEPPPAPAPLSAAACSALHLALPETHGVLAHEVYAKAFTGMESTLRAAVCACPPRTETTWLMVRTTPDHGDISARSTTPDAAIDACLAAHLERASLPRFHVGTDCIDCGPRRYGVLRGSPPADTAPRDGIATITFPVGVLRR